MKALRAHGPGVHQQRLAIDGGEPAGLARAGVQRAEHHQQQAVRRRFGQPVGQGPGAFDAQRALDAHLDHPALHEQRQAVGSAQHVAPATALVDLEHLALIEALRLGGGAHGVGRLHHQQGFFAGHHGQRRKRAFQGGGKGIGRERHAAIL